MGETLIWHLRLSTWSLLVGGAQTVHNGLIVYLIIVNIPYLLSLIPFWILLVIVALYLFGLALGVLLLVGVMKRKRTYLICWLGSAGTLLLIFSLSEFTIFWLTGSFSQFLYFISVILYYGFGIRIVYLFQKELHQNLDSVHRDPKMSHI